MIEYEVALVLSRRIVLVSMLRLFLLNVLFSPLDILKELQILTHPINNSSSMIHPNAPFI